ncbi:MAG: adenylate/guanylate cyclase domain-containing protein [Candidatus Bipolaricaulota bacterium]|nr:MAG: adenylate/guanylate cyclase domain-containing protein [Candidatus Bipolaricaulota bacterium]
MWLFIVLAVPSTMAMASVSWLLHGAAASRRMDQAQSDARHALAMRNDAAQSEIQLAVSDLLFLAELNEIKAFISPAGGASREKLEAELLAFSNSRAIYDQIRILSAEGRELLRVNRADGESYVVPASDLQFKGDRYYFEEARTCEWGTVYVSPLDLNVENGQIELPLKPIMRFAVGLGAAGSNPRYLILNLDGTVILDAYERAHTDPAAHAFLLGPEGHWILGPTPDVAWGFVLPERRREGFHHQFPDVWRRMLRADQGQFLAREGVFTFVTLVPYRAAEEARCAVRGIDPASGIGEIRSDYLWRSVSWLPAAAVRALRTAGAAQLAGWNIVGALLLGSSSWALCRWLAKRSRIHREALEERSLLESTLQRYIPPEVYARVLATSSGEHRLGGESRDVAAVFVDVRGFTGFAEENDPQVVVSVLNRILATLTEPLGEVGGILDKFVGDGFLAFFEPRHDLRDAVDRAVRAARRMQQAFQRLREASPSGASARLGLGIGISAGEVVIGNVGSSESMDYTIIGDAVNVAARLQSLAKAGEILIADAAYSLLSAPCTARWTRSIKLKGRDQPLDVHSLEI